MFLDLLHFLAVMADKPKSTTGFKQCQDCGRKMPNSDGHDKCVYCLGVSHLDLECSICQGFCNRALEEHRNKIILKGLLKALFEKALYKANQSPQASGGKSACLMLTSPLAPKSKNINTFQLVPLWN